MTHNDCFQLGTISRTHGNSGSLTFWLDVDDPVQYLDLESVLIEIGQSLVPFFIKSLTAGNKQQVYVTLDDIDTIDKAQKLVGNRLYLPLELLPKLEGNKFYFHEIVGFDLIDTQYGLVGLIKQVYDLASNPLLSVDHNGAEVLIPLADPFIVEVDRAGRRFVMTLPDGLIDLYINP
ncbi:MAG: ribosome maturation factor RimM [Bacteroidales bacterium]|nr:ribosome maturation factor RimM [Bacteroidales bacterium]MDD3663679.1 ribosome maturation factor RimM [Bacteroidales bacterium]